MAPSKGSLLLRFVTVASLVVLDQWSKAAVFRWLDPEGYGHSRRQALLGEWLNFSTSCNPGAAFGQFQQFPHLLVIGRTAAVLFLTWLLLRADSRPRLTLVAMTLVLSGALGNLIDNLWTGCQVDPSATFRGVRDFIEIWYKPLFGIDKSFPAFNVADSCITVGACAWILAGFLHREPQEQRAPSPG